MRRPIRSSLFITIAFLSALQPSSAQQQEKSILYYIQLISKGESGQVAAELPGLYGKMPRSGGILYVEGLIANTGEEAIRYFRVVADSFPHSEWADDALARMVEYYMNEGEHQSADHTIRQLIAKYPQSPYITTHYIQNVSAPPNDSTSHTANATQGTEYAIQVGAYAIKENAERARKLFTADGYNTTVYENFLDGKNLLYLVWIGSYPTRESAEIQMKEVKDRYKINGILRTRSNWKKW